MLDKKRAILFLSLVLFFLSSCAYENRAIKKTSLSYSHFLSGLVNERLGNFKEASLCYKRAQEYDRTAAILHLRLAFDLIKLEKYAQAVGELEKALFLAPEQDDARYVLALLYVQLDNYQKAIEQYERLLESRRLDRSQNIELRRILSQLYFLKRDYLQAKRHCQELLKLDPLNLSGLYFLATIDLEEGRISDAVAGFETIIENYPQAAQAKNALAYLYCEEGVNLPQALVLAEEALEIDPLNGAYLDTLGWIYFKLGDYDQALMYLEKASQLAFDPEIFDHLGQAYAAKNMMDKAKKAWESSLRLDPSQKSVQMYLKRIK